VSCRRYTYIEHTLTESICLLAVDLQGGERHKKKTCATNKKERNVVTGTHRAIQFPDKDPGFFSLSREKILRGGGAFLLDHLALIEVAIDYTWTQARSKGTIGSI
jgi:hypothetical protein